MKDQRIPVLAIVGPTGVGKTALAISLAGKLPIEAVSADSRQVYRGMDIGTGKPTSAERRALRHHLVDVVDPDEPYDAARFATEAAAAIVDIRGRGGLPVLVGGTGLYFRALVRGLDPRPPADEMLRARLRREAACEGGAAALHRRLATLDPETAARLHPRDLVRVTRALEVVMLTGRSAGVRGASWTVGESRYRLLTIGLTMRREDLYARLDARVDRMLAEGLVAEVHRLLAAGFGVELPAMQGIGYRHLVAVVTKGDALDLAIRAMKRDTRRYAKRQWTWFAREPGVRWISMEAGEPSHAIGEVKKLIELTRLFDYAG